MAAVAQMPRVAHRTGPREQDRPTRRVTSRRSLSVTECGGVQESIDTETYFPPAVASACSPARIPRKDSSTRELFL